MAWLSAAPSGPGLNNFFDGAVPENALRRRNLEIYLAEMLEPAPTVLLLGEAPGFRGMRITGVPFTNRTMFDEPPNSFGLFGPGKGYRLPADAAGVASEPTATVMWEVLTELRFLPLLWSACPWHTSLLRLGLDVPKVRHPAHGGRSGFRQGLESLPLQRPTPVPPPVAPPRKTSGPSYAAPPGTLRSDT